MSMAVDFFGEGGFYSFIPDHPLAGTAAAELASKSGRQPTVCQEADGSTCSLPQVQKAMNAAMPLMGVIAKAAREANPVLPGDQRQIVQDADQVIAALHTSLVAVADYFADAPREVTAAIDTLISYIEQQLNIGDQLPELAGGSTTAAGQLQGKSRRAAPPLVKEDRRMQEPTPTPTERDERPHFSPARQDVPDHAFTSAVQHAQARLNPEAAPSGGKTTGDVFAQAAAAARGEAPPPVRKSGKDFTNVVAEAMSTSAGASAAGAAGASSSSPRGAAPASSQQLPPDDEATPGRTFRQVFNDLRWRGRA